MNIKSIIENSPRIVVVTDSSKNSCDRPSRFHYFIASLQNNHETTVITSTTNTIHTSAGCENVITIDNIDRATEALTSADLIIVADTTLDNEKTPQHLSKTIENTKIKKLWINTTLPPEKYTFDLQYIGETSKFVDSF